MDKKILNDFYSILHEKKDLQFATNFYNKTKHYTEDEFRQIITLLAVAASNYNSVLSDIRKLQLGTK